MHMAFEFICSAAVIYTFEFIFPPFFVPGGTIINRGQSKEEEYFFSLFLSQLAAVYVQ